MEQLISFKRFFLFCCIFQIGVAFTQTNAHFKAIHKTRKMSVTIFCEADSSVVYTGNFKTYRYLCLGNVVHVNGTEIKSINLSDSIYQLDFTHREGVSLNEANQFVLYKGQVLKIRLIREKGIRIPKRKQLKIVLTINNERVELMSERYQKLFCRSRIWNSDRYQQIPMEVK
ncbi:MAG: hypothetical protein ACO1N0_01375 [Fluviicola sp.]